METAAEHSAVECIQVFEYPASHEPAAPLFWETEASAADSGAAGETELKTALSASEGKAAFEEQLAEEARRGFETGRERGRAEGRQAEREAQAAMLAAAEEQHRRQAAELIEQFAQARDRYLQAVEHEVVHLALAVAARILRREAQMDPLLLTGAVRVALGQLSDSTRVRLRVPVTELELWKETIAVLPNLPLKPTVEAGEGMRTGECELETELGSVDLGVRAQLAEIERGFFDRAGSYGAGSHGAAVAGSEAHGASREAHR